MTPEDRLALERAGGLKAPPIRPPKTKGKGPTAKRRAQKRRALVKVSRPIRERVLALDGMQCRWPGCDVPQDQFWGALEAAHYAAAGMGGDPNLDRYTDENLITLCRWHHRGPHGLHSGDVKMAPLDVAQGMRGFVDFLKRYPGETDRFYSIGVTSPRGYVEANA